MDRERARGSPRRRGVEAPVVRIKEIREGVGTVVNLRPRPGSVELGGLQE